MQQPASKPEALADLRGDDTARLAQAFFLGYSHAAAHIGQGLEEHGAQTPVVPSFVLHQLVQESVLIREATEACRQEMDEAGALAPAELGKLRERVLERLQELDAAAAALEARAEQFAELAAQPASAEDKGKRTTDRPSRGSKSSPTKAGAQRPAKQTRRKK